MFTPNYSKIGMSWLFASTACLLVFSAPAHSKQNTAETAENALPAGQSGQPPSTCTPASGKKADEASPAPAKAPSPDEIKTFISQIAQIKKDFDDVQKFLAQKSLTDLKTLTALPPDTEQVSADDDALVRLGNLTMGVTEYIKAQTALSQLDTQKNKFDASQKSLDAQKKIYDLRATVTDTGFLAAVKDYDTLTTSATSMKTTLATLDMVAKWKTALQKTPVFEQKLLAKIGDLIAALHNLPVDAGNSRLREALAKRLPDLAEAVRLRYLSEANLTTLNDSSHLKKLFSEDMDFHNSITAAQTELDKLNLAFRETLGKQDAWYARLSADILDESKTSKDIFDEVLGQPRRFTEKAHAQAKIEMLLTADMGNIIKVVKTMLSEGAPITKPDFPAKCLPERFFIQALQSRLDDAHTAQERLNVLATELNYAHPFDITLWQADQIPLYYFDDVAKLIQVLNPTAKMVGTTTAQQAAQAMREKLNSDSQALQNARAKVEDTRNALAKRTEDLRQTRIGNAQKSSDSDAKVKAAQKKADDAAAHLRDVQQKHDVLQATAMRAKSDEANAQKDYDEVKGNAKSDAVTLERSKTLLTAARSRMDAATQRVDIAEADVTKASSENDAAQAALKAATGQAVTSTTEITTQLTTLQTQLDTALTNELDAQAKVRDSMTNAFLTAQAENAAFAFARDNAPFWMAVPTSAQLKDDDPAVSSDPVNRVMLFAFPNSRTLFIRGSENDVALVKEMVAGFDQPQAQAEMTVYSMEIGSQTTKGGVVKAIEAMRQVEEELAIHHAQVDTCLTYLRQLINREVESVRQANLKEADQYSSFYDDNVLTALNYDPKKHNPDTADDYLPLFLPRLSGTATLAESLIVLALAKREIRQTIITEFTKYVDKRVMESINELPTVRQKALDSMKNDNKDLKDAKHPNRILQPFPNLKRLFLNLPEPKNQTPKGKPELSDSADVRAFQQEIIGELKDNTISSLIIQINQLSQQDAYFENKIKGLDDRSAQIGRKVIQTLDHILAANSKVIELELAWKKATDLATHSIELEKNLAKQNTDAGAVLAAAIKEAEAAQNEEARINDNAAKMSEQLKTAAQKLADAKNGLTIAQEKAKLAAAKKIQADADLKQTQNDQAQEKNPEKVKLAQKTTQDKVALAATATREDDDAQKDVMKAQATVNSAETAASAADTAFMNALKNGDKPDVDPVAAAQMHLKEANSTAEKAAKQDLDLAQINNANAQRANAQAQAQLNVSRITPGTDKKQAMSYEEAVQRTKIALKASIKAKADAEKTAKAAEDAIAATNAAKAAREEANQLAERARTELHSEIKQLADDPIWNEQQHEADNIKEDRQKYIDQRKTILERMKFPTAFALSTMEVKAATVTLETDKFKTALQATQQPAYLFGKFLADMPSELRKDAQYLNAPNHNYLFQAAIRSVVSRSGILIDKVDAASKLSNPFAPFNRQGVVKLISQARGETRADWYQQRHTARARTNETLKRFIMAVDEDIKGQYVSPLMRRLQLRLLKADLQVGILQKTSILASNRLIARVDPQASAGLAVGEEQNILQESLQLAQLITSAQTSGAATALTGGAGGATTAVNVLKGLNGLPQKERTGVYGITTGNVFQVTPIFDPTGQALRFRFDYVAANQVRDPSGKTDTQMSRIERHSINTEVQLSNYQLRNVSSFVSNAKLGKPTRFSGGIPILKDIPIINQIPLLGWFTRSGGQAAIVQQSVVLAHTSMYPTIQDVIAALVQPSGRPEADFSLTTSDKREANPTTPVP